MEFNNINIQFKDMIIYKNFNIKFELGKINCIIGKSGCGKTTLLDYISNKLIDNRIKFSYVFQQSNLIPWKNVYDNIKLTVAREKNNCEFQKNIDLLLDQMELKQFKYSYPYELSGGVQQKVNIIRALIGNYKVIIMDEPFKSLDIKSKRRLLDIIKNINLNNKVTIILVTHNEDEILELADNVYLIGDRPIKVIEKGNKNDIEKILKNYIQSVDYSLI